MRVVFGGRGTDSMRGSGGIPEPRRGVSDVFDISICSGDLGLLVGRDRGRGRIAGRMM
jgi:hypothetical protein